MTKLRLTIAKPGGGMLLPHKLLSSLDHLPSILQVVSHNLFSFKYRENKYLSKLKINLFSTFNFCKGCILFMKLTGRALNVQIY